jgi:hypothetical protein
LDDASSASVSSVFIVSVFSMPDMNALCPLAAPLIMAGTSSAQRAG